VKCCEEIMYSLKMEKRLSESGKYLKISNNRIKSQHLDSFPLKAPVDLQKIRQFFENGEHSDINIFVNGHGLIARGHKLILSLWSVPFAKVCTLPPNTTLFMSYGFYSKFVITKI
jgi:hypothetical protein